MNFRPLDILIGAGTLLGLGAVVHLASRGAPAGDARAPSGGSTASRIRPGDRVYVHIPSIADLGLPRPAILPPAGVELIEIQVQDVNTAAGNIRGPVTRVSPSGVAYLVAAPELMALGPITVPAQAVTTVYRGDTQVT